MANLEMRYKMLSMAGRTGAAVIEEGHYPDFGGFNSLVEILHDLKKKDFISYERKFVYKDNHRPESRESVLVVKITDEGREYLKRLK
jgi:hypothetical protein